MKSVERIRAVASKEWRLNSRFPVEYFAGNFIGPFKTALLMCLLYGGFLRTSGATVGVVQKGNYQLYVLLGTTCHSLFTACIYIFWSKMVTEKWWQTVTATLISPASIFDVILGFVIGSGGLHFAISLSFLAAISFFFHASLSATLVGVTCLGIVALMGFGLGLIGAMLSLCFEGKGFLYDYSQQAMVFLSCFYYPAEIIPAKVRWIVQVIPTYHVADVIHRAYLTGVDAALVSELGVLVIVCMVMLAIPAYLFDYSLKRFGIIGY